MLKNLGKVLEVFDIQDEKEDKLGEITDVISYEMSQIISDEHKIYEQVILAGRALPDKKVKGKKKSCFCFYKISDLTKPIKSFSISVCDSIKILISPINHICLVHSMSDESNVNYYGDSTLYIADVIFLISFFSEPLLK
jgi:hypothetical protein